MTPWKQGHWLVLDTETTGWDPETARVVELGAVVVIDGKVRATWSRLVNPGCPIPPGATEVHGITNADVVDAPDLEDAARSFLQHPYVTEADVIVGYNIMRYDAPLLEHELGDKWLVATAGKPMVDPLVVLQLEPPYCCWKGPGRHKLVNVAKRLHCDGGDLEAHRAVADCLMTRRVLHRLLDHFPDDLGELNAWMWAQRHRRDDEWDAWHKQEAV